jgi:hypothetical protein
MNHAKRMIETNPSPAPVDAPTLAECIEACFDCAQTCTACADACLGEEDIQMLAASASISTVRRCAARRAGYFLGSRAPICRCCKWPLGLALRRVVSAARSANATPITWSTAVSAPRSAAAARAPAITFCRQWGLR